jgi:hypothetical protein
MCRATFRARGTTKWRHAACCLWWSTFGLPTQKDRTQGNHNIFAQLHSKQRLRGSCPWQASNSSCLTPASKSQLNTQWPYHCRKAGKCNSISIGSKVPTVRSLPFLCDHATFGTSKFTFSSSDINLFWKIGSSVQATPIAPMPMEQPYSWMLAVKPMWMLSRYDVDWKF